MIHPTLEERVISLEQTVAAIVSCGGSLREKDWRSTVGMFEGDSVMTEIQEEGRKLRDAQRQAAQQEDQT